MAYWTSTVNSASSSSVLRLEPGDNLRQWRCLSGGGSILDTNMPPLFMSRSKALNSLSMWATWAFLLIVTQKKTSKERGLFHRWTLPSAPWWLCRRSEAARLTVNCRTKSVRGAWRSLWSAALQHWDGVECRVRSVEDDQNNILADFKSLCPKTYVFKLQFKNNGFYLLSKTLVEKFII